MGGLMGMMSGGGRIAKVADALEGYIPLFRGTDKRGFSELKSTDGGVYGDGVYFYTEPLPARSHATWPEGGVITGYAKPEDLTIKGNIAVLKDVNKFIPRGKISLDDTLSTSAEFIKRAEKALSGNYPVMAGLMAGGAASAISPERANAEALEEPTFDPTTLMAGPARWGGGLMNMGFDTLMKYIGGK